MANELVINTTSGLTLYALLFDATGQVWNGAAFEACQAANWTDYDIAMTEVATTGVYLGTMPAVVAGAYAFAVRRQAGVNPAVGDVTAGAGELLWTGTAEDSTTNSALLNEIQALPAAPSAADVADAVWDETIGDHAGVGSTGEALAGATAPTAAAVADAVWDEMSTGHTDAGKAGQQLWTDIDAIKAKTDAIDTATITVVSGISGATLTLIHAATFDVTVTGLTIPSDWTKVLATLKRADTDTDADALAQAQASNPAAVADGLIRLNGAAPGAGEAVWSVLTVDQAAGSVRWVLHQPATATLKPRAGRWDLKVLTADSPVEGTPLVVSSPANVVYTTTRSVS